LSFSDFKLKKEFITSIEAAGYITPTPLQSELIPIVAERKSAIVWTQSASGKTGAFLIPAMNYILENPDPDKRGARILILTSRRDRVSQINYTIKRLSSDHIMRFGFIVSGRPYQTQMRLMRRPLDIMIATPGRLNDLMNNGKADFSGLEMLIIDDLSSIYHKKLHGLIEKIIEQAGDKCLSLTFVHDDEEVTPYVRSLFSDAIEIEIEEEEEVSKEQTAKTRKSTTAVSTTSNKKAQNRKKEKAPKIIEVKIPQQVHIADDYTHKIAMMDHLLDEFAGESTIIYTSTHKAAKTLQENLSNHGHAAEIVSELDEDEIESADNLIIIDQDKQAMTDEMIAKKDTHIIHFDLPRRTDKYLERLSHHADDRENDVLLMVDGYNYNELKHIEKTIGASITQITVPGLEPLNPFTNKSKPKPSNKKTHSNQRQKSHKPHTNKARNTKKRNTNNRNKNNNRSNSSAGNSSTNNGSGNNNNNSRRQRKGPFGRLNGGANRKKGKQTIGVSRRGTDAPTSDRAWQSDFAEPKERKVESKSVTIRYSRKRTILEKPKPEDT